MAPAIRISDLVLTHARGGAEVSARIDARAMGWRNERLWFRMPAGFAADDPHGDPFVAAMILPAMAAGLDLALDGPLSPSLATNLERLQALLLSWNWRNPWTRRLRRIQVRAARAEEASTGRAATGLFFSGGVDSWHALLHAQPEVGRTIDALLFVHGYDVPLSGPQSRAVLRHLRSGADGLGVPLITMASNYRRFSDPAVSWDMAHGSGLAAAAHALGGHFDRWYVSSSDAHLKGLVSGTTRDLDPLWSRDGLSFDTIAIGIDRRRKLAALVDHRCVQQHLIVCWRARGAVANCGTCAKCVSTMLQLLVLDALDRFGTLPHQVSARMLSADAILVEPIRLMVWEDLLVQLRSRGEWRDLADAVDRLIARTERFEQGLSLANIGDSEGRRLAAAWVRRLAKQRLPVAVRRRVLAVARGTA
jgi:hypothetical protein